MTLHFKLAQAKKPFRIIGSVQLELELDTTFYQPFPPIIPIYQTLWSLLWLSSFKLYLGQKSL